MQLYSIKISEIGISGDAVEPFNPSIQGIQTSEYRIVLINPKSELEKHNIEKFDCIFGINICDEFSGIKVTYTVPYIIKP